MGLGVGAGGGQGSGGDHRMTDLSSSHRSESQGQDSAGVPPASITIHPVSTGTTLRTGKAGKKLEKSQEAIEKSGQDDADER